MRKKLLFGKESDAIRGLKTLKENELRVAREAAIAAEVLTQLHLNNSYCPSLNQGCCKETEEISSKKEKPSTSKTAEAPGKEEKDLA